MSDPVRDFITGSRDAALADRTPVTLAYAALADDVLAALDREREAARERQAPGPGDLDPDSFMAAVRRTAAVRPAPSDPRPAGYGAVIGGAWREFDDPSDLVEALRKAEKE